MWCYEHSYGGKAPCPFPHAYEGDREYLNSKISKLENLIVDLALEVEGLKTIVKEHRRILMHSTPQEPRKRGRPTTEAPRVDWDAVGRGVKEITQRRPTKKTCDKCKYVIAHKKANCPDGVGTEGGE